MIQGEIKFSSISDINDFVKITSKLDADIDVKKGSMTVDGKSIQGLYNFEIGTKLICTINTTNENIYNDIKQLDRFVVTGFSKV